jgi:HK97 family phage portal protein
MRGILGAIADGIERKTTDMSALTWERLLGAPNSKAGVSVTLESSLKVSTVLACTRVLANGVSQVPLKLYRETEGGAKLPAKDERLYRVLWRRPNDWMTSFEFRQVMMFHAVLTGNAYAYIGRSTVYDKPSVEELIPLVGNVCVKQANDYSLSYEVSDSRGIITRLPRESVFHLRGPSWNGYAGLDALQYAREAIGLAIATEQTHSALHANAARPGGLISIEGKLGADARDRLREQLVDRVEGLANACRTLILDQKARFTPFAMTGVDNQHLETRRHQIEEICRDLGVFPMMVGYSDKTSTFASAESFFLAHVIHSLAPWIENWEQSLARDLFPDDDDLFAKFSLQGLLRGDAASRAEYYASGIVNGWLTRNDARVLEDMNPLAGLDDPLVPLNMGTQAERDALANQVQKAVKSMIGHNGGPALDDVELESKIAGVIAAFNRDRRNSHTGAAQ